MSDSPVKVFMGGLSSSGNLGKLGDSIGFNNSLKEIFLLSGIFIPERLNTNVMNMSFSRDVIEREGILEAFVKRKVLVPLA